MLYKIIEAAQPATDTAQRYACFTQGLFGRFYAYLESYYNSPEIFESLIRYERNQVAQKKVSLLDNARVFPAEITAELRSRILAGDAANTVDAVESAYIGAGEKMNFSDVVQDVVILSIQCEQKYPFIQALIRGLQDLAQDAPEQNAIQEQLCFIALYFHEYTDAYVFLKQDMDSIIADPVYEKKTEFDNQEFRMLRFVWVSLLVQRPLAEIKRYVDAQAARRANPNEVVYMANALFDVFGLEYDLLQHDGTIAAEKISRISEKINLLIDYLKQREVVVRETGEKEVVLRGLGVSFFFADVDKLLCYNSLYELFHNNHSFVYQLKLFEMLQEKIMLILLEKKGNLSPADVQRLFTNKKFIEAFDELARMVIAKVRVSSLKKYGAALLGYSRYVPEILSGNSDASPAEIAPEDRPVVPWACLTYMYDNARYASLYLFFEQYTPSTYAEKMQALNLFSAENPEDILLKLKLCQLWKMKSLAAKIQEELLATYPEYRPVFTVQRYLTGEELNADELRVIRDFFAQKPRGWDLLLPVTVDYDAVAAQVAERLALFDVDRRMTDTGKTAAVEALGQAFGDLLLGDTTLFAREMETRGNVDVLAQQETIFEVLAADTLKAQQTLDIDLRRLQCDQPVAALIHKLSLYFKNEKVLQVVFYCGNRTLTAQLALDTMVLSLNEYCPDPATKKEISDVLYRLFLDVSTKTVLPELNQSDKTAGLHNMEKIYRSIDESPRKRRIMKMEYDAGYITNIDIAEDPNAHNPFDARYFRVLSHEGRQYVLQPLYGCTDVAAESMSGLVRLGWTRHTFRVSGFDKENTTRSENSVNRYVAFMLRSQNLPDDDAAVKAYLRDVRNGKIQDQSLYYDDDADCFKFVKGCDFTSRKTGKELPLLMDTVFVKGYVRVYPQ